MSARKAEITRETLETRIRLSVDLDGAGVASLASGIGFFDHMLAQVARHGLIDLAGEIAGDLDISDKTVAAHRLNLMDKLECQSVADLTRYAIRQGLVKP